jgi:hypothetical protein
MRVPLRIALLLSPWVASSVASQTPALVGCYTFTWSDSVMRGRLPDSIRLDTATDPLWPSPPTLLQVRPATYMSASSPEWDPIGEAWWAPRGDSLMLAYTRAHIGWYFALHLVKDSLVGVGRLRASDHQSSPTRVSAVRIACHSGLSPTDSTFEVTFRCPDVYSTENDARNAVQAFLRWASTQHPTWTVDQALRFRYALLLNHNCWSTLERMRSHADSGHG